MSNLEILTGLIKWGLVFEVATTGLLFIELYNVGRNSPRSRKERLRFAYDSMFKFDLIDIYRGSKGTLSTQELREKYPTLFRSQEINLT